MFEDGDAYNRQMAPLFIDFIDHVLSPFGMNKHRGKV